MPYTVGDFFNVIDAFAPFDTAEPWDNVGLLVGSLETDVVSALISLDLTGETLSEAVNLGANLIITHHPVIFPSIKKIDGKSLLHELVRRNISVISAHTNYDRAENGVNDALAGLLELQNVSVLKSGELQGIGRIGTLGRTATPRELAGFVKNKLSVPHVKFTRGTDISVVAVAGGSCSELWISAFESGAQALITSEIKHHTLIAAASAGFTLIDASHHATEVVATAPLANRISTALAGASVFVSSTQSDPADYV